MPRRASPFVAPVRMRVPRRPSTGSWLHPLRERRTVPWQSSCLSPVCRKLGNVGRQTFRVSETRARDGIRSCVSPLSDAGPGGRAGPLRAHFMRRAFPCDIPPAVGYDGFGGTNIVTKGTDTMRHPRLLALALVLLFASSHSGDAAPRRGAATPPRLLSLSPEEAAKLPPEVVRHLKEAEKAFVKASYHLHMAEELMPDLDERISGHGDERSPVSPPPSTRGLHPKAPMKRFGGLDGGSLGLDPRSDPIQPRLLRFRPEERRQEGREEGHEEGREEGDSQGRREAGRRAAPPDGRQLPPWDERARPSSGRSSAAFARSRASSSPRGWTSSWHPAPRWSTRRRTRWASRSPLRRTAWAIINGELRCWNKKTKRWESF